MRIYKVAHENIRCPKELRKVEIHGKEDVMYEIKHSDAYDDMAYEIDIQSLPAGIEYYDYLNYIISNWLDNAYDELMKNNFLDLGDYDLVVEV